MIFAVIFILVLVILVIIWLFNAVKNADDTNKQVAEMKKGKGVFLTFHYSPEEWQYFTRNLVLSGKQGKALFGEKLILLTDGTEDVITELFELNPSGKRLYEVKTVDGFLIFTIKYRDFRRNRFGERVPIEGKNDDDFEILIPVSQIDDAKKLLEFYQKLITQNNDKRNKIA